MPGPIWVRTPWFRYECQIVAVRHLGITWILANKRDSNWRIRTFGKNWEDSQIWVRYLQFDILTSSIRTTEKHLPCILGHYVIHQGIYRADFSLFISKYMLLTWGLTLLSEEIWQRMQKLYRNLCCVLEIQSVSLWNVMLLEMCVTNQNQNHIRNIYLLSKYSFTLGNRCSNYKPVTILLYCTCF